MSLSQRIREAQTKCDPHHGFTLSESNIREIEEMEEQIENMKHTLWERSEYQ